MSERCFSPLPFCVKSSLTRTNKLMISWHFFFLFVLSHIKSFFISDKQILFYFLLSSLLNSFQNRNPFFTIVLYSSLFHAPFLIIIVSFCWKHFKGWTPFFHCFPLLRLGTVFLWPLRGYFWLWHLRRIHAKANTSQNYWVDSGLVVLNNKKRFEY